MTLISRRPIGRGADRARAASELDRPSLPQPLKPQPLLLGARSAGDKAPKRLAEHPLAPPLNERLNRFLHQDREVAELGLRNPPRAPRRHERERDLRRRHPQLL